MGCKATTTLIALLCVVLLEGALITVMAFARPQLMATTSSSVRSFTSSSSLFAKKPKKKKKQRSGARFGGANLDPCPCGSSSSSSDSDTTINEYKACCGKLHTDLTAFKQASAEQVVRARYAAYAKRQVDFLMASTHPYQKDFDPDVKRWKEKLKENMYDNFNLIKCNILNHSEDESTATVAFVAELILKETGETTRFMETAQLQRATTDGRWLYLNGTIAEVPAVLADNIATAES